MSAVTHPDADAFIRKCLECPSDATTRLVFADWLEETGEPDNAAWAHFIRLRHEADLLPSDSPERHKLDRRADAHARQIRANLTVPAKLFVEYPKSLQQLLPIERFSVQLAEFAIPREVVELVPESVARENLVIPIDAQERVLLVAAVEPQCYDTLQKLQFILDREIVSVAADRDDLQAALDRSYGLTDTESVDSIQVDFTATESAFASTGPVNLNDDGSPVVRLVNLILQEAINLRADRIQMFPEPDGVAVRYRIEGDWVDRGDRPPLRLLRHIARRLALMVAIPIEWASTTPPSLVPMSGDCPLIINGTRFRVTLTMQPSPDGATMQIDLVRDPPNLSDR